MRLAVAAGLPRQARQGGDGRPGARVRHRPVGQGHAGHLDAAAGPGRHRGGHHRSQPRSAFGQLRRAGHEPDPRAGRGSSARCTTPTARCASPASTTASRKPSAKQLEQWAGPRLRWSRVPRRRRPERAGGRDALQRARADLGAADRGVQRHHRRLSGRRHQDGDPVEGVGEDHLPAGAGPGPQEGAEGRRGLRRGAAAEGLPGRVLRPRTARTAIAFDPKSPHIARAAAGAARRNGASPPR